MNKSWKKQREFRGDLGDMSKPTLAVSVDLIQEKINFKRNDGGIWFSFLTFWGRLQALVRLFNPCLHWHQLLFSSNLYLSYFVTSENIQIQKTKEYLTIV